MQNANNKKQEEKDMTVIKREEYKDTPKEGFIIAHFLSDSIILLRNGEKRNFKNPF